MGDNNGHVFGKALYCDLTIKEEVPDYDSQMSCSLSQSSCFVSQNEDSLLSSISCSTVQPDSSERSPRLQLLRNAVSLISEMQRLLRDDIQKIELLLKNNLKIQDILNDIIKEEAASRSVHENPRNRMKAISVFAAPYFRDVKKMIPPFNEDTKIKRKNCDVNGYVRPPKPWSKEENQNILDGVTRFALWSALKPHNIKRNYLKKKLKEEMLDFEKEIIEKHLYSTEKKIKAVSKRPLHELLTELQGNIDWMQISSVNMQGKRLPEDCEIMWNNYLAFTINKEAFSKEEDSQLHDLAEDHKERDWDFIADSLQTNRTPIQCFERYQTHLSVNLKKKYWTREEDARLTDLVNKFKYGEIIPWNKVSTLMEGRTRQQCINRYERSISQSYKFVPWTPEEDGLLIACYRKFGTQWAKMKSFFKRRSTYAIRERYCNALDPSLKMGVLWSIEEDNLLISLIRQYGLGKWSRISRKVPGRTDNMCLNRAATLFKYSVKYHSNQGREVDPGIYDAVLFGKILRPIPQPERFRNQMKVKPFRKDAISTLLKALETVLPDVKAEVKDFNEIDFYWISSENLYQISEELHRIVVRKEEVQPSSRKPFTRYYTKSAILRKREYDEESNDDIDEYQSSPEKTLPDKEKDWLDLVLATMLQMTSAIIKPNHRRKPQVFTSREYAEISLYKAYLYKQFGCSAICDDDDNIENVTFSGINFSETLQTVVSYFVQPPIYENQFIVLAPNMTTLGGMEVVEVTENRLLSMSKCVSHSKNYIDYICERRESCPKCMQCLSKFDELHAKTSSASVISNMKNKYFFINETIKTSAYIESASVEKCVEDCSCTSLQESRKAVQLLRKRFMALFLWPAFLAATDLTPEQENILCTRNVRAKNYFWHTRHHTQSEENESILYSRNIQEKKKGKLVPKIEPTEDSAAAKVKTPYVKRKNTYPEVLRRSKRLCVLRRTSFGNIGQTN